MCVVCSDVDQDALAVCSDVDQMPLLCAMKQCVCGAGTGRKKGSSRTGLPLAGQEVLTEDGESCGAAASGVVDLQEMITTLVLALSVLCFLCSFLLFMVYSLCQSFVFFFTVHGVHSLCLSFAFSLFYSSWCTYFVSALCSLFTLHGVQILCLPFAIFFILHGVQILCMSFAIFFCFSLYGVEILCTLLSFLLFMVYKFELTQLFNLE